MPECPCPLNNHRCQPEAHNVGFGVLLERNQHESSSPSPRWVYGQASHHSGGPQIRTPIHTYTCWVCKPPRQVNWGSSLCIRGSKVHGFPLPQAIAKRIGFRLLVGAQLQAPLRCVYTLGLMFRCIYSCLWQECNMLFAHATYTRSNNPSFLAWIVDLDFYLSFKINSLGSRIIQ